MSHLLKAYFRSSLGKGPARRLRAEEKLPAVLYGQGQKTVSITVCPKETAKVLLSPMRKNSVIDLELYDDSDKVLGKKLVMIKERQIHKTKRSLIHVDFVEIDKNKPVNVSVPVILNGKNEAIVQGGKLDHVLQKIKIACLPEAIPHNVEVDIGELGFGSTHASDIKLPEGVKLAEKPRVVLLTIKRPRGTAKEGEEAQAGKAAPAKK